MSTDKPPTGSDRAQKADRIAAACIKWREEHGPEARRARALERLADRAGRTPEEQLELLVQRPGRSRREVRRLKRLIHDRDTAAPRPAKRANSTAPQGRKKGKGSTKKRKQAATA